MHPATRPPRPDVTQELERFTRICRERGLPVTQQRLKEAFAGESQANRRYLYSAREVDFDKIAAWFKTLARAEKSHAGRFTNGLETLVS